MPLYETLATAYDELFPVNPATLDFLEGLFPAFREGGRPARALDIGSATGGHALALARKGWAAVGLEPSTLMVDIARKKAAKEGLEARFLEAGMEDLGSLLEPSSFDLIACLGNTLPHLGSTEALGAFFMLTPRLLAPGGCLVLQLLNYALKGAGDSLPDIEAGKYLFKRRYRGSNEGEGSTSGRGDRLLVFETELREKGGEVFKDETLLFPFRPAEILSGLAAAGFASVELFSGWDRGAFREDSSPFLIVSARL